MKKWEVENVTEGSVTGVVLAAGSGARLAPMVKPFEKPLVRIGGKQAIVWASEALVGAVEKLVCVANPKATCRVQNAMDGT